MCHKRSIYHAVIWLTGALIASKMQSVQSDATYSFHKQTGNIGKISVKVCQTNLRNISSGNCTSYSKGSDQCITRVFTVYLNQNNQLCNISKKNNFYHLTVRSHTLIGIISENDKLYTMSVNFDVKQSHSLVATVNVIGKTRRPFSTTVGVGGSMQVTASFLLISLLTGGLLLRCFEIR